MKSALNASYVIALLAILPFLGYAGNSVNAPIDATPETAMAHVVVDLRLGANGMHVWQERDWRPSTLLDTLTRLAKKQALDEIRLLDKGLPMTMRHMIEIARLG